MSDIDDTPPGPGLPPELRFLKTLVSVLAGVMILGLITIVGLLVTRLPDAMTPAAPWPDDLTLPDGVRPVAVTRGPSWIAVVTDDDRIVIFDAEGQAIQEVGISLPRP